MQDKGRIADLVLKLVAVYPDPARKNCMLIIC